MASLYEQTIPVYIAWLKNADTILDKAAAWAKENGKSDTDILNAALVADMKPLSFQITTFTNHAKNTGTRVFGQPEPELLSEMKTLADAKKLITQTSDYLKTIPSTVTDASGVELVLPFGTFNMTAAKYTQYFAIPNFYFHYTTYYDILRMLGVEIGKKDYLAGVL